MEGFKKYLTDYKKDDIIFKEGESQENFFIINKGMVHILSFNGDVLTTLSKGDFFGEESLNESQSAVYTVEVIEDSSLIKIPYSQLTEMMKKSPDIALKILKKLSEKNIKIVESLMALNESTGSGTARILKEEDSREKTTPPDSEDMNEEAVDAKLPDDVKAYLIIQKSNRIVQLEKASTFIGRRDYTTGFIPDIDLTKEDDEKYISRKHAQIAVKDGKFYFSEEQGAVNGTFLNGNKLNTGVKYEIKNEDKLTLCHLDITFKI